MTNSSKIEVISMVVNHLGEGDVEVRYVAQNKIQSGDGETLSRELGIYLNGQFMKYSSHTLPPGDMQQGEVVLSGVSPGENEVCVHT